MFNIGASKFTDTQGRVIRRHTVYKTPLANGHLAAELQPHEYLAQVDIVVEPLNHRDLGRVTTVNLGQKSTGDKYTGEEVRNIINVLDIRKKDGKLSRSIVTAYLSTILQNPTYYTSVQCNVRLRYYYDIEAEASDTGASNSSRRAMEAIESYRIYRRANPTAPSQVIVPYVVYGELINGKKASHAGLLVCDVETNQLQAIYFDPNNTFQTTLS